MVAKVDMGGTQHARASRRAAAARCLPAALPPAHSPHAHAIPRPSLCCLRACVAALAAHLPRYSARLLATPYTTRSFLYEHPYSLCVANGMAAWLRGARVTDVAAGVGERVPLPAFYHTEAPLLSPATASALLLYSLLLSLHPATK